MENFVLHQQKRKTSSNENERKLFFILWCYKNQMALESEISIRKHVEMEETRLKVSKYFLISWHLYYNIIKLCFTNISSPYQLFFFLLFFLTQITVKVTSYYEEKAKPYYIQTSKLEFYRERTKLHEKVQLYNKSTKLHEKRTVYPLL